MLRGIRIVYVVLAWTFAIGVLAQVFFIGLGLLGGNPAGIDLHRNFGWIIHLAPLLVLLFAALSRAGSRHWQWALALAIVTFIVPVLATLRTSMPVLAAVHPVGALVVFALAVVVAWNSVAAVRLPVAQGPARPESETSPAA